MSTGTLEVAFSKLSFLWKLAIGAEGPLPLLRGRGNRPNAIEHYKTLENLEFPYPQRGDAYRHLEVSIPSEFLAPEHSTGPKHTPQPPTPAQSAVPPTDSREKREEPACRMEVPPGTKVFPPAAKQLARLLNRFQTA